MTPTVRPSGCDTWSPHSFAWIAKYLRHIIRYYYYCYCYIYDNIVCISRLSHIAFTPKLAFVVLFRDKNAHKICHCHRSNKSEQSDRRFIVRFHIHSKFVWTRAEIFKCSAWWLIKRSDFLSLINCVNQLSLIGRQQLFVNFFICCCCS